MAEKRKATDENTMQFVNTLGPPLKRTRRVPQPVTEESSKEARKQWEDRQREEAAAKAEFLAQREREEEAERRATSAFRIGQVLEAVKGAGYKTLHEFLADLMATKDQHQSSQVSQMLINHGHELLDLIRARQPELVSQWITKAAGEILGEEGANLVQLLRPPQLQNVSTTLANFSLERTLADAEYAAPTLCFLLRSLARGSEADDAATTEKRRDTDLVCDKSVQNHQLTGYQGCDHRHLHVGADAKRKVIRVSDHNVFLPPGMRSYPVAVRRFEPRWHLPIISKYLAKSQRARTGTIGRDSKARAPALVHDYLGQSELCVPSGAATDRVQRPLRQWDDSDPCSPLGCCSG